MVFFGHRLPSSEGLSRGSQGSGLGHPAGEERLRGGGRLVAVTQ